MKCTEINSYIPLFLENRLMGDELSAFLSHIKDCDGCREEIETNYLIQEALKRLEEGESFDLHSEFQEKLSAFERLNDLHNMANLFRRVILIIAGFLTSICLVSMFL
ncbi:MAG: zf-HC2 domain-containing protein [Lachnospiraceae bacterium]|nr:zf-HC2 domain-containing protein [Lachnospiraceae bacterium]